MNEKAWYEVFLSSDDKSGENEEGTQSKAVCDSLVEAVSELEKRQAKDPGKDFFIDHWLGQGQLDEEFLYISKKEIYGACDNIRNNCSKNDVAAKIANYIEANIDEFMDCYNTDVDV